MLRNGDNSILGKILKKKKKQIIGVIIFKHFNTSYVAPT